MTLLYEQNLLNVDRSFIEIAGFDLNYAQTQYLFAESWKHDDYIYL